MAKFVIVNADDWQGIYVDGELIQEGHSIDIDDALQLAIDYDITEVETKWANTDWLEERGTLPIDITDVLWEGDSWYPDGEKEDD